MGLRGRFIYLAGAAIGGAFFSFVIGNLFGGGGTGLVAGALIGGTLLVSLFIKQRKGLYARKKYRGVVVFQRLKINHLT